MSFKTNALFVNSGSIIGISVGHSANGSLHNKLLINYNNKVNEIHLAFHHSFVCTNAIVEEGSYIWEMPTIPESRLKSLAARCLKIIKTQSGNSDLLPYALSYQNIRKFDRAGVYSNFSENSEYGMTCATFILTVFNSVGLDLLDWKNWEDRVEDSEWFDKLLRILNAQVRYKNVTQEHYDNVASERNCAKIRPEEVFSSVYCKSHPMKFACSTTMGSLIRNYCLSLPNAN